MLKRIKCYVNVKLMTDRNFSSSFALVLRMRLWTVNVLQLRLWLIAIRKAQRFRFLALYHVFERRQHDFINALLTATIKR